MGITTRKDLNDPNLSELKKTYLLNEAKQRARRLAEMHNGEYAYLLMMGHELIALAKAQAPKPKNEPTQETEGLFDNDE